MKRTSPLYDCLKSLNGSWQEINGMPALVNVQNDLIPHLSIADLSFLTRFGVKGLGAASWLESQGIVVPDRPNTWNSLVQDGISQGGIIARLGLTEFLIEDSIHSHVANQLSKACGQLPSKVYPVLRQDAAIAIRGSNINELLQQTCSVNFRALSLSERPVILTSMVGVSVTIIPGEPYRIWCDGTFGAYLWRTLGAIVEEMGGGVVGVDEG
jgi:sarcosine oxidase, subunit gamma